MNKILKDQGIRCLIHQPSYSMLNRWIEKDLLSTLKKLGIGCIAFSPLAQGMLSGYKELNEGIGKTTDLIKNVDSASKEQQSGIEQINDAVTQIDQQTQRNSSAAMETNDIAITTEKLAETIISGVNRNQFKGKDDVEDRREDCRDLNYQGDEKRRAETQIKAASRERENGKNESKEVKPREVKDKENLNKSNANEWESF